MVSCSRAAEEFQCFARSSFGQLLFSEKKQPEWAECAYNCLEGPRCEGAGGTLWAVPRRDLEWAVKQARRDLIKSGIRRILEYAQEEALRDFVPELTKLRKQSLSILLCVNLRAIDSSKLD